MKKEHKLNFSRLEKRQLVLSNDFSFFPDGQDPEKISMEGVVRLLEDLQLSPDSKLVLLMAWKFQAAAQCEFSREEFLNGMSELG